jgi:tetratricopeptide (TPR) repeat protein
MRNTEHERWRAAYLVTQLFFVALLCVFSHARRSLGQESSTSEGVAQAVNDERNPKVLEENDNRNREKAEARNTVKQISDALLKTAEPDPQLFVERAYAYMILEDFNKAFDDYTKAIESPGRADWYLVLRYRVFAAVGKGDYVQALNDAKDLTKASPPQAGAYAICALILARSPDDKVQNAKEALEYASHASVMDDPGKDVKLIEMALAAAYSANGDFKEAVSHQEKAMMAAKGGASSEMKAQLEAYKGGKEYLYPFKKVSR